MSGDPADGHRRPSGHVKVSRVSIMLGESDKAFQAVADLSFEVAPGELLCLLGPSGCGKSTVLGALAGHLEIATGAITLDGEPVAGPSPDRGLVFQQHTLFPWKKVRHNVAFGPKMRRVARRERLKAADDLLALVGLAGFEDFYPAQLSGGMQQRVEIARVLINHPRVLLMDEPFAALDAQTRETLQGELLRIWRATGKTIVFITHGIDEAVVLGQRVAVMTSRPGRIKQVIDIPEVLRSEAEDVRALPEFGEVRHEVWSLLREEVQKAQQLAGGVAARRLEREVKEVAHV